ncbi:MAG TPA: 23S rRNA (pseudouridine(1915)-N(3))-methyltransferase RlmH [Terriglobia bacterium]|nr:23S rRNA (pseudouridine(1915)-N(3))-methyltransferase RlmH [Terriglobia bacterium]
MKVRIVWIGKTKNPAMARLCDDYVARIKHFLPLEIAELKELKVDPSDRIIALDPKGKSWTSDAFAKFLDQHMTSDPRRLTFIIGDYAGLPESAKKQADVLWSLSPLTFTHDLTRVLLLEQIYRALTIIKNLPYSK